MKNDKFDIKSARIKAGFTQQEISRKLGMSRQTYQKYENGNMSFRVDTAWKFAAICKISFDSIIFFKEKYTSSVV